MAGSDDAESTGKMPVGPTAKMAVLRVPLHHLQEPLSGTFDIRITELVRPAFHREQRATMDVFEIAKRKFVFRLVFLRMRRIDPEMPICIFSEAVVASEIILFWCGRTMISPIILLIHDDVPVRDQLLSKNKGAIIEPYGSALGQRRGGKRN